MKKSAKTRIIIWGVISAVLCLTLVVGVAFSNHSGWNTIVTKMFTEGISLSDNDLSDYTDGGGEFSASAVKALNINWNNGGIKISQISGSKLTVSEDGSGKRMCTLLKNGTLHIEYSRDKTIFGFADLPEKKLIIGVPRDSALEAAVVNGASAEIEIEGLSAIDCDVNTASGNIRVKDCKLPTLSADTASGGFKAEKLSCDELSVNTVSGNVNLDGDIKKAEVEAISADTVLRVSSVLAECEVESVSGSVTLLVNKDSAGFTVEKESVSGDVSVLGVEEVTTISNTYKYKDGAAEIDVKTVSGDILIKE